MNRTALAAAFVALSIAAIPSAVKAQNNPTKASTRQESDLKDSVKGEQSGFSKLIQTLMTTGHDWKYSNGFAQVVGLDGPMPAKVTLEVIDGKGYKCHVVYANDDGKNRPLCVYFIRANKTKTDLEERYFRVSLDGKLERVVTFKANLDENGKPVREGRSKFDEDIDSPEIRKAFKTDMSFWVKDWLRKQEKLLAKKGKEDSGTTQASPESASSEKAQ